MNFLLRNFSCRDFIHTYVRDNKTSRMSTFTFVWFYLNLCVGGIKLAVVDFMVKIYIFFTYRKNFIPIGFIQKKIHYLSECEWMIKPKQMKMKRNNPM